MEMEHTHSNQQYPFDIIFLKKNYVQHLTASKGIDDERARYYIGLLTADTHELDSSNL